jgi:hypothetical protein
MSVAESILDPISSILKPTTSQRFDFAIDLQIAVLGSF